MFAAELILRALLAIAGLILVALVSGWLLSPGPAPPAVAHSSTPRKLAGDTSAVRMAKAWGSRMASNKMASIFCWLLP